MSSTPAQRELVLRIPVRPTRGRVVVLAVLVLTIVSLLLREEAVRAPASSVESAPVYGRCTGVSQGVIKGDVTVKGREGQWTVTTLTHHLGRGLDGGAQPFGDLQHEPVVLTMPVTQVTPKLLTAMSNTERLSSCVFDLMDVTAKGQAKKYYSLQLADAYVVDYRITARNSGPDVAQFSLTYGSLTSTFAEGGVSNQVTWPQPGA